MNKTGRVIGAAVVTPDDDLTLITSGGIALRTSVNTINTYGRSTSGVKLIDLADDDALVGMAIVEAAPQAEREALAGNGSGDDLPDELVLDDDDLLDEAPPDEDVIGEFDDEFADDDLNGDEPPADDMFDDLNGDYDD